MIKAKPGDPALLLRQIQDFLAECRRPAVLEYGEQPVSLLEHRYSLEIRSGRVGLEVWDEERCFARRISAIERLSSGMLDCQVERFAGKPGKLTLLDLDRPHTIRRSALAGRHHFAEKFRRILYRQFPGWCVSQLSTGLDLQRSLSSVFPRARLERADQIIAAVACPAPPDEAALLTYALLWHNHLCHHAEGARPQLCLFLPEESGTLTAQRLRWLAPDMLHYRLFLFNEHGSAGEVDPRDLGNLETSVSARYAVPEISSHIRELLDRIQSLEGVGICAEGNGGLSISCRGLEFARVENGLIQLGLQDRRVLDPSQNVELEQFAAQISALCASSGNAQSAMPAYPERWFESIVRSHLSLIDADLLVQPLHGQVLSFAAIDRDLIDLLGVTSSGRLAVLELKVSEDIHLPIQALDYWMRIRWHAERNELAHLFPGIELDQRPPKLLLIAPAFSFHPATDTLMRYFSPAILVERVGVNTAWQKELKVVLRLRGSETPISHQMSNYRNL